MHKSTVHISSWVLLFLCGVFFININTHSPNTNQQSSRKSFTSGCTGQKNFVKSMPRGFQNNHHYSSQANAASQKASVNNCTSLNLHLYIAGSPLTLTPPTLARYITPLRTSFRRQLFDLRISDPPQLG